MSTALPGVLRFLRGSLRPRSDLRSREVSVEPEAGSEPVPATLIEPDGDVPRVGWVVLHGLTRPGRAHPSLVRFTQAVATAGGRVLVPEIPEWTELHFAPERAQTVIRGAVDHLAADPRSVPGGVILVGFSFGAPQALLVGADPAFRSRLRGVLGWGGYADLRRTMLFLFTGEHEWQGQSFRLRPDPYGRWIIGANCLHLVPGIGDVRPVADALRTLAIDAGERQVVAWDPVYHPLRRHLRRGLPHGLRPLYDLFVPPEGDEPDPAASHDLIDMLIPATRREVPLLDPLPSIEGIHVPVRLMHARTDHLIPFTETLALAAALSQRAPDLRSGITGLLGHSGWGGESGPVSRIRETAGFLRALSGIFELAADGRG